ncbi:MAG: hypothetical protein SGCHY_005534, partial [Lobulomycetales sp.]
SNGLGNTGRKSNTPVVVGSIFGVLLILSLFLAFFIYRRQRRRTKDSESYGPVDTGSGAKDSEDLRNKSFSSGSSGASVAEVPTIVTPAIPPPPARPMPYPNTLTAALPVASRSTAANAIASPMATPSLPTSRIYVPDFAKGSVLSTGTLRNRFIRATQRHLPGADDASSDEIILNAGDLVFVEKIFNDGWCLGWNHRTGKRGMFPHNALAAKPPTSPAIGQAVERPGVPGLLNGLPNGSVLVGKAVHTLREARMLPDPSFTLKQGDVVAVEHVYEDGMAFGFNYSMSQRGFFPIILLHLYHEAPIYTQHFDHSFRELDYPTVMYEAGLAEICSSGAVRAVLKDFDVRFSSAGEDVMGVVEYAISAVNADERARDSESAAAVSFSASTVTDAAVVKRVDSRTRRMTDPLETSGDWASGDGNIGVPLETVEESVSGDGNISAPLETVEESVSGQRNIVIPLETSSDPVQRRVTVTAENSPDPVESSFTTTAENSPDTLHGSIPVMTAERSPGAVSGSIPVMTAERSPDAVQGSISVMTAERSPDTVQKSATPTEETSPESDQKRLTPTEETLPDEDQKSATTTAEESAKDTFKGV